MKEREMLLRKLSSAQFAAWEIRMYLDTHPDNRAAAESLKKYMDMAEELRKQFEEKYGPLTSSYDFTTSGNAWVQGPWPWEMEG